MTADQRVEPGTQRPDAILIGLREQKKMLFELSTVTHRPTRGAILLLRRTHCLEWARRTLRNQLAR